MWVGVFMFVGVFMCVGLLLCVGVLCVCTTLESRGKSETPLPQRQHRHDENQRFELHKDAA